MSSISVKKPECKHCGAAYPYPILVEGSIGSSFCCPKCHKSTIYKNIDGDVVSRKM